MLSLGGGILPSIAAFAICIALFPGESKGMPALFSSPDMIYNQNYDHDQLSNLIKLVEKAKAQPNPISGQVRLRAPRSELVGDMAHALRLYQLQELDRMYGAKSRPRFGKRGGTGAGTATQDEVPIYGYYDGANNGSLERITEENEGETRRRR